MILIVIFIILLGAWVYFKSTQAHSIWKNKGAPESKPAFLFGQTKKLVCNQQTTVEQISEVYNKLPNERYIGFYQFYQPLLMIRDLNLLKQLTVKEFDHFTDHVSLITDDHDPLFTQNLFSLKGEKWRDMRATLSPAFTSSKMKAMFSLMAECSEQFVNYFLENPDAPKIIELKETFTRFANDVIATCAFGIKCDSLKQQNNEFYSMGKKASDFSSGYAIFKFTMFLMFPKISKLIGLKFFEKDVAKFFKSLIKSTVKMREENRIIRPDVIHLLMEARKGKLQYDENLTFAKDAGFATAEESDIGKVLNKHKFEISDNDMTAQALVFFFAGFDTISTVLSFIGYELAVNPDIQDRLRDEIDKTLEECNGKITYDAINKMKYLDMVISESLRKWPSLPVVDRVCVNPFIIKAETPNKSDLQIDIGQALSVPIWALHYDPQYFPNPEKFDPDRFSDENKHNIQPYSYLPFGVGPRNCIGSRFALLEIKILYFNLLSKLELQVVEKTSIPMKLKKGLTGIIARDGTWVGLKPRRK